MLTDEHKQIAAELRASGTRYVSPFRLGIRCGETWRGLQNPYETAVARKSFEAGVTQGRRLNALALAAKYSAAALAAQNGGA